MRPFTELATDLASQTVAHYNFITPNICNDMHDSCAPTSNSILQGDTFLAQTVPLILNSAAYQQHGLLLITWDEGSGSSNGPIGMIALSPLAKGSGYHNALHYTHSSTVRTLQKIFGDAPSLGGAATALDLSDLFLPGAIPNADPLLSIQEVAHTISGTTLRWTSQPGITYRVEWKAALDPVAWQAITPDFAGTGSLLSWTDDGSQTGGLGASQRFYRVVVP